MRCPGGSATFGARLLALTPYLNDICAAAWLFPHFIFPLNTGSGPRYFKSSPPGINELTMGWSRPMEIKY